MQPTIPIRIGTRGTVHVAVATPIGVVVGREMGFVRVVGAVVIADLPVVGVLVPVHGVVAFVVEIEIARIPTGDG